MNGSLGPQHRPQFSGLYPFWGMAQGKAACGWCPERGCFKAGAKRSSDLSVRIIKNELVGLFKKLPQTCRKESSRPLRD